MIEADVIVVGSGPAGAQAAERLCASGLSVLMLDYGNDAPAARATIPAGDFAQLRRSDPDQRAYFLDERFSDESARNDRLGAHFTAPRAFIVRDAANLLPLRSKAFSPVQSLALGGLGAGWGAGAPTFEPFELHAAGLPVDEMAYWYDETIRAVGVSAAPDDDTAPYLARSGAVQPAAAIDENATSLLGAYAAKRDSMHALNFYLGRAPLAMLTRSIANGVQRRDANPYDDMDFYGDAGRSIYRPRYTVEALLHGERFTYRTRTLVRSFEEHERGVTVRASESGTTTAYRARALVLAAGAINSARIVLASRAGGRTPILCNPMSYLVCVNRRMFGRPANGRRHSLAQLMAVHVPEHRGGERVVASFYSYRSLMQYRLVRALPLPVQLGLPAARLLTSSLTLVAVHHPERGSPKKFMELEPDGWTLRAHYERSPDELSAIRRDLRSMKTALRAFGCVPLTALPTPDGSSIHYAGTLNADAASTLTGCARVFVADASAWKSLPAKGLTLTLMANARRVAAAAAALLGSEEHS